VQGTEQSLEQIEGDFWGDPPADATLLTATVHALLAEGDFCTGDLLVAVLRVPPAYWRSHSDEAARLGTIADSVDLGELDPETRADVVAFRGNGH
jgi:hypothetical protein